MEQWLSENWFNLFSTIGIVGSLWIAIVSLRSETKTRRISNLFTITTSHLEIRREFVRNPELARVTDPAADLSKQPITPAEESFVNLVISHTGSVYEALKDELLTKQEGLHRDIAQFFSLPIPNAVWTKTKLLQNRDFAAVWTKTKLLQNRDFAAFIDSSLKES